MTKFGANYFWASEVSKNPSNAVFSKLKSALNFDLTRFFRKKIEKKILVEKKSFGRKKISTYFFSLNVQFNK